MHRFDVACIDPNGMTTLFYLKPPVLPAQRGDRTPRQGNFRDPAIIGGGLRLPDVGGRRPGALAAGAAHGRLRKSLCPPQATEIGISSIFELPLDVPKSVNKNRQP
jgi:hypothetical protein